MSYWNNSVKNLNVLIENLIELRDKEAELDAMYESSQSSDPCEYAANDESMLFCESLERDQILNTCRSLAEEFLDGMKNE